MIVTILEKPSWDREMDTRSVFVTFTARPCVIYRVTVT